MTKKIVVTEYASLDGVIEDPVGMENSGLRNWTDPFNRGPDGDQFKLEEMFAALSTIERDFKKACGRTNDVCLRATLQFAQTYRSA